MKSVMRYSIVILIIFFLMPISGAAEAVKWVRGEDGILIRAGATKQLKATRNDNDSGHAVAVARTRKQILMLDDLYKTAVVLMTEHYVHTPSTLSAATAAKALFAAMKEKGWHDARLIGFTKVLVNPSENSPQDKFEKTAKSKLLEGAATHEEVTTIKGQAYLRMATSVPVVMEKCVMCHANFKGNPGAIGAISYTAPLIK